MKFKRTLLLLLLFSFSIGTVNVFAEDEENENQTEESMTDEELAEEQRKLREDPLYRDKEILKTPIETPASVTGEKYNGSGTVVDFSTTGSRAFYTVQTTDHSVYYIIIDLDKTESNVYFLSEINGEELSLSDITSNDGSSAVTDNVVQEPEETDEIEEVITEPSPTRNSSPNWSLWLILIGAVILFGYQFFFGKLKKLNPLTKNKQTSDDSELPNEEEIYYEEEYASDDDDDEI